MDCLTTLGIQVVSIATISITWVSMTASVMGQNLYFNIAVTPLVGVSDQPSVPSFPWPEEPASVHAADNSQQTTREAGTRSTLIFPLHTGSACICLPPAEGVLCKIELLGEPVQCLLPPSHATPLRYGPLRRWCGMLPHGRLCLLPSQYWHRS